MLDRRARPARLGAGYLPLSAPPPPACTATAAIARPPSATATRCSTTIRCSAGRRRRSIASPSVTAVLVSRSAALSEPSLEAVVDASLA